jgi:signal recognition particle subunit SRP19
MVSKGQDRVVLWPRYFDRSLSRSAGRRVPETLAVRAPDAAWIEAAARKAGFDAEVEDKARDPAVPYERSGRVLVRKSGPKEAIVQKVAERMRESQDQREGERRR